MVAKIVRKLRVLLYARISREDVGNVENTDIQLRILRRWCQAEGHEVAGEYVDNDIGAFDDDAYRPAYERLLAAVQANQGDAIAVTEDSRLNRNLWRSIHLFHLAFTTDLKYILTPDEVSYDLSTKEGIHEAIGAAINAEKESMRTSKRQKAKKLVQAEAGMFNGGTRPYGYDTHCKEIVEPEATNIREATRRLIDGESAASIIKDWRERGIKTAKGKEWHLTTLRTILTSPRICGIRTHLGVEHPAQWPAIISRDDWELLQITLDSKPTFTVTPRRYLLSGVVICGRCEAPMIGRNLHDNRRGVVYHRYICPKDSSHRGCGKVFRNADPLEELVTEAVLRRLDSPDFLSVLATQTNNEELQDLLNERQLRKDKLRDILADYASGLLTRQEYAEAKAIVEKALERVNNRLKTIQGGRSLARIPLDGTLRAVWKDADVDFRRDVIRLLVKKIVVLPGRSRKRWPGGGFFDPSLIRIVWEA
jgi:site-specific DNA recombinase